MHIESEEKLLKLLVIEVKKTTRKECYKCKFLAAKEYFDFNKKSTTQRNKILELEFSFFKYSC